MSVISTLGRKNQTMATKLETSLGYTKLTVSKKTKEEKKGVYVISCTQANL